MLLFTSWRRAWLLLPLHARPKILPLLVATLRGLAPIAFRILDAFSSTPRQARENSAAGLQRKELVRCNTEHLAATGAARQHFSVFGALGMALGYTTVISKG
ncbi:hypothetical protein R3P38DRAFT_2972267, partial [Favolaschia claudopus]